MVSVVMGAGLAGIYLTGRMVSWKMTRFGAGWWAAEVLQMCVIVGATALVLHEMHGLEVQIEKLKGRLDNIAKLMRGMLKLDREWKQFPPSKVA